MSHQSNALAVREPKGIVPVGIELTRTGLAVNRAISIDEWTALGKTPKFYEGAVQWWIGDWLTYGEKSYGEKYVEAIEATGFDYGYLRNLSSVAKKIEMSRRRDNLSWSHHQEVAGLEPDQQNRLLDWAATGARPSEVRPFRPGRTTEGWRLRWPPPR